jgi:hypothetical protein
MRPVREFDLTVALDHGQFHLSGLPSAREGPTPTSAACSASASPTVKTHVSSILTRLDLDNRVQIALALLVHDAGLLDEQP